MPDCRRLTLLLALSLPWLPCACANVPLRSTWVSAPPPSAGPDPLTAKLPAARGGDVDLWAGNDGARLYLTLSTVAEHVKDQWLGVYGQSLLVFLDPSGRAPGREGLRLTLAPPQGVEPPWDPHQEMGYLESCADRVERVRRRPDGALQALPIHVSDADWEIHFEGPRLVYRLSLPLTQAQGWDLGLAPGQHVGLRLQTTPIEPHRALAFRLAHEPAPLSRSAKISSEAAPGDSVATLLRRQGVASVPQDARRLDPTQGGAQPVREMAPYPPPNQVPDPLDLGLSLQLAPAPKP